MSNTITSFRGYYRDDGSVGVRNQVLIIPTVVCASIAAKAMAERVVGVKYLNNPYGCAQAGYDLIQTEETLIGLGLNPNVASVLVVSLGCESVDARRIVDKIARSNRHVDLVIIQEVGGVLKAVERGIRILKGMVMEASKLRRDEASISKLVIALKCGASDATSGLASNPAVGVASDMIVSAGGTAITSEVPELIGAEHLFTERAINEAVKEEVLKVVKGFEERLKAYGVDFRGAQPSPGNIAGGLTTIEEKSLGAIQKSGRSPVKGVLRYAERPPGNGLYLMVAPGFDVESTTGMVAGGAQVVLFTTGLGTPLGNPVAPVVKITGNPETAKMMKDEIDVDVSSVILGVESIDEAGRRIFNAILDVASGKLTKAEALGHDEFGIFRVGPTF